MKWRIRLTWLLAAALLLGLLWQRSGDQQQSNRMQQALEYDLRQIQLQVTGADGRPRLNLTAQRLWQTSQQAPTQLQEPDIRIRENNAEDTIQWRITGRHGQLANDGSWVELHTEVQLIRLQPEPPLRLESDHIRYDTGTRQARSESKVRLLQGNLAMQGSGMVAELGRHSIRLQQAVEGVFHAR